MILNFYLRNKSPTIHKILNYVIIPTEAVLFGMSIIKMFIDRYIIQIEIQSIH